MRPSQLYGIHDDLQAWAFDRACVLLGVEIENDLDQIKGKNDKAVKARREQRLQKWLGGAEGTEEKDPKPGRFRDPVPGTVRRV